MLKWCEKTIESEKTAAKHAAEILRDREDSTRNELSAIKAAHEKL
jgi:hypothetical protein